MLNVGIRELKNQATEILRAVREDNAEYIVTYRGQPIAFLLPLDDTLKRAQTTPVIVRPQPSPALLAELEALRQKIGKAWKSNLTAAEAMAEQRRSL